MEICRTPTSKVDMERLRKKTFDVIYNELFSDKLYMKDTRRKK